jgi:hypothetical protein
MPERPQAKYAAAYSISDDVFQGQLSPDGRTVNFNKRAAEALRLEFGDGLRIEAAGQAIDAYFIGDAPWALSRLFDKPAGDDNPWLALWTVWEELGKEPVLMIGGGSGVPWQFPAGKKARWRPVTVARSTRSKLATGFSDGAPPAIDGSAIRARVATCVPTAVTLHVDRRALQAIGACPSSSFDKVELRLKAGDDVRRLTLCLDPFNWGAPRFNFYCAMGDVALSYYQRMKKQYRLDTDDPDRFTAAVGTALITQLNLQPLLDEIKAQGAPQALAPRPFPRPLELVGATHPHWSNSGREILWIEALAYVRDDHWHSTLDKRPADHELKLAPGDEVILTKPGGQA